MQCKPNIFKVAGQGMMRCTVTFVDKLGEVRSLPRAGYKGAKMAVAKGKLNS